MTDVFGPVKARQWGLPCKLSIAITRLLYGTIVATLVSKFFRRVAVDLAPSSLTGFPCQRSSFGPSELNRLSEPAV